MLDEYKRLSQLDGVFEVVLHNCMLGGERRKATKLLTNVTALRALACELCSESNGVCDRTGVEHLSWDPEVSQHGSSVAYQTEGEAEYP